jgi:hypothetical protein
MVSFNENTLTINGRSVRILHKIFDVAEGPTGTLVLLDPNVGLNQNVFFLSPEGRVKWQIELFSEHPDMINGPQSYSGIWNDNGRLTVLNTLGFLCEVDPETGCITQRTYAE